VLGSERPSVEQLRLAKREAQRRLADHDGVEGIGIGDGCLRVYVRARLAAGDLPTEVEGVRVECIEIGTITAQSTDS
jgi:hypothetical protein